MARRIIPAEWPIDRLAKYLLEYGDNVKICVHCGFLIEKDGIAFCDINDLSLDDFVVERTTCRHFKKKYVEKN